MIGAIEGRSNCLRIVMAHTDSARGPGANDNASGVGTLVALAPRLQRPACDTWLVATGSEERIITGTSDHLGALALVRKVRAPRPARAAALGAVPGRGRAATACAAAPSGCAPRPRRRRAGVEGALLAAARRTGVPTAFRRDGRDSNSDHREFARSGPAGREARHRPGGRALPPQRLRPLRAPAPDLAGARPAPGGSGR